MSNIFPAVSVIIPMYNAENYIAVCLESILSQTFKNFEVIVVDDCSTDNSVEVVASFAEKFGERLKLAHMEENSGSGALPRNKGLKLSCGEYIFFIDNDDLITKTALEELYNLAKTYDAEVVQCEKNYRLSADALTISQSSETISTPKFETTDLRERVHKILKNDNYMVPQWTKFVRRDFIFENELFFPNTRHGDDVIWTWALVICAKKFLRVPNIVYCQRLTKNSILQKERTPLQGINFWLNPVILALNQLDKVMSKTDFFKKIFSIVMLFWKILFISCLEVFLNAVYKNLQLKFMRG